MKSTRTLTNKYIAALLLCLGLNFGVHAADIKDPSKDTLIPQRAPQVKDGIIEQKLVISKLDTAQTPIVLKEGGVQELAREYFRMVKIDNGNSLGLVLRLPAGQTCTSVQEWNTKLVIAIKVDKDGEVFHRLVPLTLEQLTEYKHGAEMHLMQVSIPSATSTSQTAAIDIDKGIKPGS